MDDIQIDLFTETVGNIVSDSFGHGAFCLDHGAGFGKGIQLFTLDLEYWLQTEHGSDCSGSRGDTTALLEEFQCCYCDVDTGIKAGFFQPVTDLGCLEAVFGLLDGFNGRIA